MAHNVETMAYAGQLPWHGLGTEVDNDLLPYDMQIAAGLDWAVEKQSLVTSEGIVVPKKKALIRSSDMSVLDVVGDEWQPCQNDTAFQFFNDFCLKGDMEMHTAGSLQGGKIVWVLAKVKDSFELFGGDQVDSYLLFSNPHKFGQSIDVRFTPIRVVCNNTLTLSLNSSSKNAVKLNHKKAFDADNVKEMLGIANVKLDDYKDMAEHLGKKKYKKDEVLAYLDGLFPTYSKKERSKTLHAQELSSPAKRVYDLIEQSPGHNYAPGSWWNAFNAVTYFTDHERGSNNDVRLQSAWYGQSKNLKLKALETALEAAA
jgi:phage/plasmid-like protein (TIGR03299 family)|tara:strand:- start:1846 stop:2787 length:942 start_codon:yes stop_codon:yes gene_type:complete